MSKGRLNCALILAAINLHFFFGVFLQNQFGVDIGLLHEPYVKHFTIEKYSALYELRAKSKLLVRIIFTIRPDGNVLFLAPFIKTHKRSTMQALEASLKMMSQIDDGSGSIQKLTINTLTEVRK